MWMAILNTFSLISVEFSLPSRLRRWVLSSAHGGHIIKLDFVGKGGRLGKTSPCSSSVHVAPHLCRVQAKAGLLQNRRGRSLWAGTRRQNGCRLFVDSEVPFLVGSEDCHLPQTSGACCVCRPRQVATDGGFGPPVNLWRATVGDLLYLSCWVSLSSLSVEEGKLSNEILDLDTSVQVVRFAFQLFGIKKKKKKSLQGLEGGAEFPFATKLQVVSFDALLAWQDYKRDT